ncbi:MAG TPA: lysophospholipid acyltransferase family protein [Candidatus Omnitrophota bacterium]|nr:lysophospholipid acyltransferase family protein [Candidatus Omnitrophota bacterium]
MSSNKRLKLFQRALARHGLFASAWLFDRLPLWAVNGLTKVFLFLGFTFTIRQRRIANESLRIAFGEEKSQQEIDRIIKTCFYHFGRGMIEILYYMEHPALIDEKVSFQGLQHVERALEKGNGVIAVTAHFGNFPLMMLAFAHRRHKVSCVIRPTRDQEVEKFLQQKRNQVGLKTVYAVPQRQAVVESLKILRNNEILFVPLDQNFGSSSGVFVDFFGQKAATATGPVVFAIRTKAPIIPMFIIHEDGDKHKVIIEPPIDIKVGEDEKETILQTTSEITNLIERYIRRYPHEWAWMHRRWKSKPYPVKYCPNA